MYLTYSKHNIDDRENLPFSPAEYSLFKFGDNSIAKKFGEQLAVGFIEQFKDILLSEEDLVIVPSPYNAIPTASGIMSNYFREIVNRFLFQNGRPLMLESKIHRYNTYSVDYSKLDFAERLKLMASDTYHFHESFLNNKTCLFIDDIRVTGSHEQIIKNLLEVNNLAGKFIFIYYALFANKSIPANLESYLNTYAINSFSDICTIINLPSFSPNTRIIKYILKSDGGELNQLLREVDPVMIERIIRLSLQNNYHHMPEYRQNFNTLTRFIELYT